MNILLGVQYYYPFSNGGTELYIHQIAKHLRKQHHNVAIVKVGNEANYIFDGYPVFVIPQVNFEKRSKEDKRQTECLKKFNEILTSFKPDIFHLHTLHSYLNGFFLKEASQKDIKCIFTAHLPNTICPKGSMLFHDKKECNGLVKIGRCLECTLQSNNKIFPSLLSKSLLLATIFSKKTREKSSALNNILYTEEQFQLLKLYSNLIITPSLWQRNAFLLNGFKPERQKVIKLGVSVEYLKGKKECKVENKKIRVGFIGRYNVVKGLHVLLNALTAKNFKNFELEICLAISPNESLDLTLINKLKANYKIQLHYNKTRPELVAILDNLDILCVPSIVAETGPYVVYEALSRNVPIIGSELGGIKEIIKTGFNGLLFEAGNEKDLMDKLTLLENEQLLTDLKANAQNSYSEEAMASEIIKIYQEVLL